MTIDRLFYGYMALIGLAAGALLVVAPHTAEFWIKPYFWVLIAVALFDGGAMLMGRNTPDTMLPMTARVIGFVVGALLMVAVPTFAGSPATFF